MKTDNMKFDLFVPSYKRPKMLIRMMETFCTCVAKRLGDIKCYVYFSSDDRESYDAVNGSLKNMDTELVMTQGVITLVQKINLYFKEHATADVVMLLTDDLIIRGSQIPDAMEHYENNYKNTDTILCLKSLNLYENRKEKFNKYSYFFMGRKFIDAFPNRQVCCPYYSGHGIDGELGRYAKSINKRRLFDHPEYMIHDHTGNHNKSGVCSDGFGGESETELFCKRRKKGRFWSPEEARARGY